MHVRVAKSEFDAALVPGFREATRAAYRSLTAQAGADMSAALDAHGRFLAAVERYRDCPLCARSRAEARGFLEKLGMHIVTCPGCGLIYSTNVLEARYDHQRYVRSAAQLSFEALKRNEAYARLERIKSRYIVQRLADYRPASGRLLDIGPGAARLLDAAREAGWRTCGIEVNPEFVRAGVHAGHDMIEGLFPRDMPEETRFDAIAMLDVLEHLHEPLQVLRDCRKRLAAGGVLVVQVPNVDSLLVRLEGAASMNFCHGHWNHFAPPTLKRLGEAARLTALDVETIISEIDRIRAFSADQVRAACRAVSGAEPPARLDADWLHAQGMGYKVLAFFKRDVD